MYLGIDLGTSAVKVVLIDQDQQLIAQNQQALNVSRPRPLWSEQNPADWWQATYQAILALKMEYAHEFAELRAIGFSGQMHGATILNQQGQVLRPAILWNDGRAIKECEELLAREPQAIDITANLIYPGFTAPKLLWIAKHEPDVFAQIHKVLLPKDYIRYRLSGDFATDLSDASGTSWLNVKERQWSEALLAATHLSIDHMPLLYEGPDITGTISHDMADSLGISPKAMLIAGGSDNAASAVSLSISESGQAFLSLGTSGVYFVADNNYQPNPQRALHTMCHCLPQRWHQMSVQLSAADCVNWAAKLLKFNNASELIAAAKQHNPKATPLFLPYLSGERTPHNNAYARGIFFGLTHNSSAAELAQAVLEGVAFAIAEGQEIILESGAALTDVSVIGGGAASDYWGAILTAVLNRPLHYRHQSTVGGAYGAARIAWLGLNGGAPRSVFLPPAIDHTLEPEPHKVALYAEKLALFKTLYQQINPSFTKLHDINP